MASTSLNKVSVIVVGVEGAGFRARAGFFLRRVMSIPKKDFKLALESSNSVMLQIMQYEIIISLIISLQGTNLCNQP